MNDLRHQFDDLAGPAIDPADATVQADLARGRRALRRRRAFQAAGGSTIALAAAVLAFTAVPAPAPVPAGPAAPAYAATTLVAYTGEQPKGFTVDVVPQGWFIQTDDYHTFLLAPEDIKDDPSPDPSADPVHDVQSFVGKIGVMLESKDQNGPTSGKAVDVDGQEGTLVAMDGGGTTLWIAQEDGPYLLIQFWEGIGLSEEEMISFGAGVHVNEGAQQGVG